MGKCTWCGNYIADSPDKQAFKNFTNIMGLDLITKPLGALIPQYCSKQCKLAAANAKGGKGGGGAVSAASTAAAAKAEAEAAKAAAEAEQTRVTREADAAEKKEGLAAVLAISFDGDAKAVMMALGDLQTYAAAHGGTGQNETAIRKAVWQKMALGIRMLQSEGDAANAEYFDKQLKNMKKKAFLKAVLPTCILLALIAALVIWLLVTGQFDKLK
jgi:hypothetical protein